MVLVILVKKFCPEAEAAAGGGSSQLTCTDVVSRAGKKKLISTDIVLHEIQPTSNYTKMYFQKKEKENSDYYFQMA